MKENYYFSHSKAVGNGLSQVSFYLIKKIICIYFFVRFKILFNSFYNYIFFIYKAYLFKFCVYIFQKFDCFLNYL